MRRAALLLLLALVPSLAASASSREWRFQVLLDDHEVGTHRFRVEEQAGERRVASDAQFSVKFLFIEVYRYLHQARERWRGECLESIESRTDDNGERLAVQGGRNDGRFVVTTGDGRTELPGCVMSFAYWNPAMLKQARLLNAQTGELIDVRIEALGKETVTVRGAPVAAHRYALHAPKFRIDVWYAADDHHWVQLESRTKSGRLLHYRIP